jgi:hypothetical protein
MTFVAYTSMAEAAKRYDIDGDPRIAMMDKALDTLTNAVG